MIYCPFLEVDNHSDLEFVAQVLVKMIVVQSGEFDVDQGGEEQR